MRAFGIKGGFSCQSNRSLIRLAFPHNALWFSRADDRERGGQGGSVPVLVFKGCLRTGEAAAGLVPAVSGAPWMRRSPFSGVNVSRSDGCTAGKTKRNQTPGGSGSMTSSRPTEEGLQSDMKPRGAP